MLPYAHVGGAAQDGLVGGTSLWATMWGWAGTARSTMLFFAAGIGGFVACCGVALLVHPILPLHPSRHMLGCMLRPSRPGGVLRP